jgi:DNA-binding transcriptional LysR family regulator
VSGNLDIGLIHLPSSDKRLQHRVVARYPGAIAVRYDDPLAAHDLVTIEALRDRDVVIDFARPNPVVLAGLTRSLNARGITRIVRTTNQLGGELEMATQVFNRQLVAVVTYAPASFIGRIFSPPEFKLIPIDESTWAPAQIALAWVTGRPDLEALVDQLAGELELARARP